MSDDGCCHVIVASRVVDTSDTTATYKHLSPHGFLLFDTTLQ